MNIKNDRNLWSKIFSESDLFVDSTKSRRQSRVRKALGMDFIPTKVTSVEEDDKMIHVSNTGGHLIVGEGYVTVKLPYGMSTNEIWRATIDQKGKQRNSLSEPAKIFKKTVRQQYAPMFKAIDWKSINKLCEIRLIVQPPLKTRNYSAKTYPRFDIDNYPKLLIDSLKGMDLLYTDDNIFVSEHIQLAQPVQDGCVWLSCVFIEETDWLNKDVDFNWLAGRAF